jgi:hypothetical protein
VLDASLRGMKPLTCGEGRLDALEEVCKSRIGLRDLIWRTVEALQLRAYSEVCDMQGLGLRAARI